MEASVKTWLLRLLVVVPILCVIMTVVLSKHKQSTRVDIQLLKSELEANFEEEILKLRHEVGNMQREKRELKEETAQGRHLGTDIDGGAVYVRWGREDCPSTADVVYTGVVGGGHYTHTGGGVNRLCRTHNPVWARYGNDAKDYTYLYGTEYEVVSNDFPLGHDRAEKLHDHDVPCSVCQSATHANVVMIPGTTVCTKGWTEEYKGRREDHIMAGHYSHKAGSEYICIDANPDAHESGFASEDGNLLYRVKAICGSLPCPPYVGMREITCVVCTK